MALTDPEDLVCAELGGIGDLEPVPEHDEGDVAQADKQDDAD